MCEYIFILISDYLTDGDIIIIRMIISSCNYRLQLQSHLASKRTAFTKPIKVDIVEKSHFWPRAIF